ncbi:ABC transporter substrate-binding protein [Actinoallomurus iriomotensis]|uniref:ABC transporter substrate-binding protein n=1 Tax=Actinoallomurus iriomotensis TaxID=478107 RepID=A0A9W6RC15_9ACTN|nr:ABC transporter substrate-binding protein [Actinoallomurus iriomotensis]GLY73061.1 ABC transporter substrate-binding protein [Actinoallomurus iriomotensis]
MAAAAFVTLLGIPSIAACRDASTGPLGKVKRAGRILIATDALYPPNEFKQGDQIVGFDVDLGNALARKLGVKAEFQDVRFDTILQALDEGKYDISLSSFTDTREREGRFDFVTYLSAGTMLMVPKGNPRRLRPDGLSLCGKKIAVEKGTTQEEELSRKDATRPGAGTRIDACRSAGRPAPIRLAYDDQAAATDALAKGQADASLTDSPSAIYGAKESAGRIECAGSPYATALYGIAIPKRASDLRDEIFKAMKALMSDGTYRRLTTQWGLATGAVPDTRINAAE